MVGGVTVIVTFVVTIGVIVGVAVGIDNQSTSKKRYSLLSVTFLALLVISYTFLIWLSFLDGWQFFSSAYSP